MTTYRISAPHFVAGVIVDDDLVLQAAPILHWSVGKSFETLRDYATRKGWTVEPLLDNAHPTEFECDGTVYELEWDGDTIVRIIRYETNEEPQDIPYDRLPEQIREQL